MTGRMTSPAKTEFAGKHLQNTVQGVPQHYAVQGNQPQ